MQIRVIEKKKGLGDKMETTFKALGVVRLMEAIGIEDCGCKERKEMVNKAESWVKAKLQSITKKIQLPVEKDLSNKQNTINVLGNLSTEVNLELNERSVELTEKVEKM